MLAWLDIVPEMLVFTVTRNLTTLAAFTAMLPPVAALAPVPSRTVSVRVPET